MRRILAAFLVVCAGVASGSSLGPPRWAEADGPSPLDRGTWTFDLRVVCVVGPPALVDAPDPWTAGGTAPALAAFAWPDALVALRARGRPEVLCDRRASGLLSARVKVEERTARPLEVLDRRDRENEVWKGSAVHTGVLLEVVAKEDLEYRLQVQWESPRAGSEPAGPRQHEVSWEGGCALARGRALVLVHRQQVEDAEGAPAVEEIYAFLTARLDAE